MAPRAHIQHGRVDKSFGMLIQMLRELARTNSTGGRAGSLGGRFSTGLGEEFPCRKRHYWERKWTWKVGSPPKFRRDGLVLEEAFLWNFTYLCWNLTSSENPGIRCSATAQDRAVAPRGYDYWLAAQLRIIGLLDGSTKRVHVEMNHFSHNISEALSLARLILRSGTPQAPTIVSTRRDDSP
jgi:hypothetical protein